MATASPRLRPPRPHRPRADPPAPSRPARSGVRPSDASSHADGTPAGEHGDDSATAAGGDRTVHVDSRPVRKTPGQDERPTEHRRRPPAYPRQRHRTGEEQEVAGEVQAPDGDLVRGPAAEHLDRRHHGHGHDAEPARPGGPLPQVRAIGRTDRPTCRAGRARGEAGGSTRIRRYATVAACASARRLRSAYAPGSTWAAPLLRRGDGRCLRPPDTNSPFTGPVLGVRISPGSSVRRTPVAASHSSGSRGTPPKRAYGRRGVQEGARPWNAESYRIHHVRHGTAPRWRCANDDGRVSRRRSGTLTASFPASSRGGAMATDLVVYSIYPDRASFDNALGALPGSPVSQ